jgi:uncharacterized protein YjiS (DUF1127 family)
MAYGTQTLTPQTAVVWPRTAVARIKTGWQAYWRHRAQRATVRLLQSLDDLALRDIGINRSELESVVHGPPVERRHRYHDGGGCW